jgi:signal transduction histidine kinase
MADIAGTLSERWRRSSSGAVDCDVVHSAEASQAAELAAHQQRRARSSVATIGEMTAAISHEINQPRTAILSNAEAGEDARRGRSFSHGCADLRHSPRRHTGSEILRRIRSFLQKHDTQTQVIDLHGCFTPSV